MNIKVSDYYLWQWGEHDLEDAETVELTPHININDIGGKFKDKEYVKIFYLPNWDCMYVKYHENDVPQLLKKLGKTWTICSNNYGEVEELIDME
jgi:hypothetical protein